MEKKKTVLLPKKYVKVNSFQHAICFKQFVVLDIGYNYARKGEDSLRCSELSKKMLAKFLGPVLQSIVSLTSSLRGQLINFFRTL